MNTIKNSPPVLREVLMQFSVEQDVPDQQLLNKYVERFPQFESELRNWASQLMAEDMVEEQHQDDKRAIVSHELEEAATAVSLFQARYFKETGCAFGNLREDAKTIESRLASLKRTDYRELALRLGINTIVLNQLRDREIDSRTISRRFIERFASELHSSVELVQQFFNLPPVISSLASFRSDDKPQSASKESFEDALVHSGLDENQIRSLLE